MKKSILVSVIASVVFSPIMTLAQVADTSTIEENTSSNLVVEPVSVDSTNGELTATVTVIAEPVIVTANPALDVAYCKDMFVYDAGTYDQYNNPVKAPVCTGYDVKYQTATTVDFGATPALPLHKFEVNADGKIVFVEAIAISEMVDKIIKGETDSQYYQVQGGEGFGYLIPITESTAQTLTGDLNKVINFDDSLVYTYKIVR